MIAFAMFRDNKKKFSIQNHFICGLHMIIHFIHILNDNHFVVHFLAWRWHEKLYTTADGCHILSIGPIFKTGYWLGVCHGWFIYKGVLELSGTRVERELQNEKSLTTVGIEPGAFRLQTVGATTELRRMMSVEGIKVHLVLTVLFFSLHVARCRCSKIICRELNYVNSLQSANFLIVQTAKRYQYYVTKHTWQIILLHLPHTTGKFLKIAQSKPGELFSRRQTSVFVAQW